MILVVGGAGYIGSHTVKTLLDDGYDVLVIDNLSTGNDEAIDRRAIFEKVDIKDTVSLNHIFKKYPIKGIIHFAANCYVGESIFNPLKYYDNNVAGTLSLLQTMIKHNVKKIIFSSTCAVYGIPTVDKITEQTPTHPINPYGSSKRMVEKIMEDLSSVNQLEYVILRYFNVAGADPSGKIGEDHDPETHLIPNILLHLLGKREKVSIYGNDYPTFDGTCIRDYIHVSDLAEAHLQALNYLLAKHNVNKIYNVGNEEGYSIKQVIETCEKVTNIKAKVTFEKRREGDPAKLISSSEKITEELGWNATFTLKDMIETAWNWFSHKYSENK